MTTINPIHTSCKNCVFAIYDNDTQTNCALEYIDKYRKQNIEVLEAYDNDKEFYLINNKKCIGYREPSWFNQFDMLNASLDDKINKYNETNQLQYLLVIELKNISLSDLQDLCKQVQALSVQPAKIIFIRYVNTDLLFTFDNIKNIIDDTSLKSLWRIQTMVDSSLEYKDILHNIINMNRYRFTCSVNGHTQDLNKIIDYANKIVHHDLEQIIVVSNESKNCILFSNINYKYTIFNDNLNILNNTDLYTII